jgi:putative transcriptional regulator
MEQHENTSSVRQGSFLVASPRLLDPNFQKTVVLIIEHNEDGTLGLILNRPSESTIEELWRQLDEPPCDNQQRLRVGGPVEGPLTAIHTEAALSEKDVLPGVHFSVEKEHLEQLVRGNVERVRFFVGYSGWAPGQLDAELAQGSWLVTPATVARLFEPDDDLWDKVTRDIAATVVLAGVKAERVPRDPSMN